MNINNTKVDNVLTYIKNNWINTVRNNVEDVGTLLGMPYPYVVPSITGGFQEMFYWDTYFIMLGLASTNRWRSIEDMMKNYTYQIRKYGYIPTANRSYLLSRSQPPFFSHMVELLMNKKGKKVLRDYLPYLTAEYRFWMKGRTKLDSTDHLAYRRLVEMPNGSLLNRYYDNKTTPRPESLKEDVETAEQSGRVDNRRLFLHLRAAAESGWDFSSRWLMDPLDIKTIHTADIIPVDLNSLLYHLESTIADAYKASFNLVRARQFRKRAKTRKHAIQEYLWNEEQGYFRDFNFHHSTQTSVTSLAGVFPLFVNLATQEQADRVADVLRKDFLQPGGLVTTLIENGQQWDAPNGWAPLQWVAVAGLRRYGAAGVADTIACRFTATVTRTYAASGKLLEKYDVEMQAPGGGGEYPTQDGFGWTNGVVRALVASRPAGGCPAG